MTSAVIKATWQFLLKTIFSCVFNYSVWNFPSQLSASGSFSSPSPHHHLLKKVREWLEHFSTMKGYRKKSLVSSSFEKLQPLSCPESVTWNQAGQCFCMTEVHFAHFVKKLTWFSQVTRNQSLYVFFSRICWSLTTNHQIVYPQWPSACHLHVQGNWVN